MLNKTVLIGRIVADPELKKTASNISVVAFTLAVNRSYVAKGAERETDFIEIIAWRNTAEFICRYFKKGQMMAVDGSIQTRTYTDKEGKNRKSFEVLAEKVFFCGDKATPSRTADIDADPSAEDFMMVTDDEDLPF